MEMIINRAELADVPEITQILTRAVRYKQEHGDKAWGSKEYTPKEVEDRVEAGNTYVAQTGGERVGTFMLIWEDGMMWGEQPPNAGYIHQLATRDGYRGQGFGEKMINWAAQEVAKKSRQWLRLDCSPDNADLCAYYEELGFKRVGVREIHAPTHTYMAALYERPVK